MRYTPLFLFIFSCTSSTSSNIQSSNGEYYRKVEEIPVPDHFERMPDSGFGQWLRQMPLKTDKTVYLYNGEKKQNQSAQFAVLDVSVGKNDLQQCADAVMRLRAEYLRFTNRHNMIAFHAVDGTLIDYASWMKGYRFILKDGRLVKVLSAAPSTSHATFQQYLDVVFTYCSTLSLEKELHPVDIKEVLPGDVFIHGGSPGHAVIVMDVAVDTAGNRKFLLAQSYMPAQDIHVLRNPSFIGGIVPWFGIPAGNKLFTPEWVFKKTELRRF